MTATADLARCLHARDGVIHLDIPDGVLPGFLIEAFNATTRADVGTAVRLLTPENLARATAWIESERSGAEVMALVLAMIQQRMGRPKEAIRWYRWIADRQAHPLVWNELAVLHRGMGRGEESLRCQQEALRLAPEDSGLQSNWAKDLMGIGRFDEGLELLRRAVEHCPANARLHSVLLFMMHYVPGLDPRAIFEEHRRWGQRHAPLSLAGGGHDNDPDPDRRLRIGYLSADLRRHSVAYTFEPLLEGRDPRAVEVFGYGSVSRPDDVTGRLTSRFDHYRNIYGLDDEAVAAWVERDRIDILVAVAGHTEGNRLTVLAHKPAPIQTDLGSIATLGMAQVDYRLTDAILDPAEGASCYLEALAYLPGGYVCYRPPESAPVVGPLPATRNGFVTFGSFSNPLKVNPWVIALWAHVLRVVEGSRLMMKFSGGDDPGLTDSILDRLDRAGIDRGRVQVCGWRPMAEHLELYNQVDIALDTYPFNGCLTTLEGLWMGVPMVSLTGPQYVSRAGLTILHRLGLDALAAAGPDPYILKAAALAGNLDVLAGLRTSLRDRMKASPLCDARRFAREVESAYRSMWRQWCDTKIKNQGTEIKVGEPGT